MLYVKNPQHFTLIVSRVEHLSIYKVEISTSEVKRVSKCISQIDHASIVWKSYIVWLVVITTAVAHGSSETVTQTASNEFEILRLFGAGFLGALLVKLLDIGYQVVRRGSDRRQTARKFVDEHLDPVLKAADELVGKLRSLAMDDFRSLRNLHTLQQRNRDLIDVMYLVAKFWASLELFRISGQTVSPVRDRRGKQLVAFVDCLEWGQIRIVQRSSQRAVAELALTQTEGRMEIIRYIDFVRRLEKDAELQEWFLPLERMLGRMEHTRERQRLLSYGIIVHAMIDTLDPNHSVSSDRKSYPEKLSNKTWEDLERRVFRVYLKFVKDPKKYIGPTKRRSRK